MELFKLFGSIIVDATSANKIIDETSKNAETAGGKINNAFKKVGKSLVDAFSKNKNIKETNSSLSDLTETITKQEDDLTALKNKYKDLYLTQGKNSKEAKECAAEIEKLSKELKDNKAKLSDAEKAADKFDRELDDIGDTAEKSGGKLKKFASSVGNFAKNAALGLAGAVTGLIGAFVATGESSQEFIEDMGKLTTAFTTSGHTAETAKKMYNGFVGILGETDQSVEAVNHLAKLTKSEEDLAKWTNIAAGIYGTFGDSLPLEGLTEAANETAKVGAVTGPLADALNWAGISEEKFNEQLASCNSEQERATLITNKLSEIYKEAGDTYQKVNGDLIESRKATSELNEVLAEVGKVSMPIVTAFKQIGTSILRDALPAIRELGDGIKGLLKGTDGAAEKVGSSLSHILTGIVNKAVEILPKIGDIAVSLITSLTQGLTNSMPQIVAAIGQVVTTIVQGLAKILPEILKLVITTASELISTVGEILPDIVLAITELIPLLIQELVNNAPKLLEAAVSLLLSIVEAIPILVENLVGALPQIINTLATFFTENVPVILDGAIQLLNAIIDALPVIIDGLLAALPDLIAAIVSFWINNTGVMINAAIQLLGAIIEAIPVIIEKLIPEIPKIVITIVKILVESIPKIVQAAGKLFMSILEAIPKLVTSLFNSGAKIINALIKGLGPLPEKAKAVFDKAKTFVLNSVENIKSKATEKFNSLKQSAANIFNNIKTAISNPINSAKTSVLNAFNSIKSGITEKITAAKNKVSEMIGKIKNLFNFKVSLPKLKVPHFGVTPAGWKVGDLLKGIIPKLSVQWYAKAMNNPMILEKPTIFGANSNGLLGGGEAGSEVVSGTDTLMNMISGAVATQNAGVISYLQTLVAMLADYFPEIIDKLDKEIVLDDGTLVGRMTPKMDASLGNLNRIKARGV